MMSHLASLSPSTNSSMSLPVTSFKELSHNDPVYSLSVIQDISNDNFSPGLHLLLYLNLTL